MYCSFGSGLFFLLSIIVCVMIGWLIARVKQNGHPVTEASKEQFVSDLINYSVSVGIVSFFSCLLIALIDIFGSIFLLKVFGTIFLLFSIIMISITFLFVGLSYVGGNISFLMRSNNKENEQ